MTMTILLVLPSNKPRMPTVFRTSLITISTSTSGMASGRWPTSTARDLCTSSTPPSSSAMTLASMVYTTTSLTTSASPASRLV